MDDVGERRRPRARERERERESVGRESRWILERWSVFVHFKMNSFLSRFVEVSRDKGETERENDRAFLIRVGHWPLFRPARGKRCCKKRQFFFFDFVCKVVFSPFLYLFSVPFSVSLSFRLPPSHYDIKTQNTAKGKTKNETKKTKKKLFFFSHFSLNSSPLNSLFVCFVLSLLSLSLSPPTSKKKKKLSSIRPAGRAGTTRQRRPPSSRRPPRAASLARGPARR